MQYPVSRIKLCKRVSFQSPGFHLPFGLVERIGLTPKEIQADSSLAQAGVNVTTGLHLLPFGAVSEVLKDREVITYCLCPY